MGKILDKINSLPQEPDEYNKAKDITPEEFSEALDEVLLKTKKGPDDQPVEIKVNQSDIGKATLEALNKL